MNYRSVMVFGRARLVVDPAEARLASAKVRTGHPNDDPADLDASVWAGTVPLQLVAGALLPAPNVPAGVPVPSSVRALTSLFPPTEI